jgi:hypothetical protein
MPVLTLLARDVEIATKPTPRSRRPARLRAIEPA